MIKTSQYNNIADNVINRAKITQKHRKNGHRTSKSRKRRKAKLSLDKKKHRKGKINAIFLFATQWLWNSIIQS